MMPDHQEAQLESRSSDEPRPVAALTRSERTVLAMIAEGCSNRDIADRLHRSVETVRSHRRTIGKKLGMKDRVQIARRAMELGVVPPPGVMTGFAHRMVTATVAESASVPIALLDARGVFAGVSKAFASAFNVRPQDVLGLRLEELMAADEPGELAVLLSRVLAGSCMATRGAAQRGDDAIVCFEASFLPLPPPDRMLYMLLHDVTALPCPAAVGRISTVRCMVARDLCAVGAG